MWNGEHRSTWDPGPSVGMRVLLSVGNFPGHPTGYGAQSVFIIRALRRAGHHVVILPWSVSAPSNDYLWKLVPFLVGASIAHTGASMRLTDEDLALCSSETEILFNPYSVWPVQVQRADLTRLTQIARADLFIAFQDIFIFERGPFLCPAVVWMPTHFQPVEHKTLLSLDSFDGIVAMSRYGEMVLSDVLGPERCGRALAKEFWYVPHACDTDTFAPVPKSDAERARTRMRWGWPPDGHVTLMVASNTEASNRKAWELQIQAWVRFAERAEARGERVHLHIHSQSHGALDLCRILEVVGELPERWEKYASRTDPQARTALSDRDALVGVRGRRVSLSPMPQVSRLSVDELAKLYRASDCLLSASHSEGFGVPLIEAQLCGVPVVTNRTTAMTELTLFGASVPPGPWIMRADFNSGWFAPDVDGLAGALEKVASWKPQERARRWEKVSETLSARFSSETVEAQWTEVVEDIASRIETKGAIRAENVARSLALEASRGLYAAQEAVANHQANAQDLLDAIRSSEQEWSLLSSESRLYASLTKPLARPPARAAVARQRAARPSAARQRAARHHGRRR